MTGETGPGRPSAQENLYESLSAMMDGEASELERQRLLKACQGDAALREAWSRYQLVAALVRHQPCDPALQGTALADRVSAALVAEGSAAGGWSQGVLRFAVAASVACLVVAGVQWQQAAQPGAQLAQSVQPVPAPVAQPRVEAAPQPVLLTGQPVGAGNNTRQQVRFENYMQYHLERAALNDNRGMVPLAPKVSAGER